MPPRPLNTAVLFLIFNRIDSATRVFEAIRQARPQRLYVAADGPRTDHSGEAEKVAKVREIATKVDWPCEVKTLFREKNLGCKRAVGSAITWFFEQEEQGIILEDDCLPHQDFFHFCEKLLNYYRYDKRVFVITGDNFQKGQKRGDGSYYFSRYNHVWGWASWRRAWKHYDVDLSFWPEWRHSQDWFQKLPDTVERKYWQKIFDRMYEQKIDTWDYSWTASVWFHGGLTATPNVNLVSNIGFGPDSTHTKIVDSPHSAIPTSALGEIIKPTRVILDREADLYTFDHVFGGKLYRFPWPWLMLPRRAVSFFYRPIRAAFVSVRHKYSHPKRNSP